MIRSIRLPACGALAAMALFATSLINPVVAAAEPPGTPSKATAQSELDGLPVQSEGSMDGYDRDRFPHWIDQGESCDTREAVLKRDADSVEVGSDCYPTSGSWYSYYDGETWTQASDLDIDHIVPLAEAWRSGAASWDDAKRQDFANDLTGPQLIAVTDNVNQSKGDQDPSAWTPPRAAAECGYSKWWIHTKHHWGLHLQEAEKTALQSLLDKCSY